MRVGQFRHDVRAAAPLTAETLEERPLFLRDRPVSAKVPLANARGSVAVLLRKSPDRESIGRNQRRAPFADDSLLQSRAPVISARQQRVTRGRAAAATAVSVRETHSLRGKIVHVRRRNLAALRIIALHIPITEVVGQDDEEVGTRAGSERRAAQDACQQATQQWTSPIHDSAAPRSSCRHSHVSLVAWTTPASE